MKLTYLLAEARRDVTGEALARAKDEVQALAVRDSLIPAAAPRQALLESVLLEALGSCCGSTSPLGVAAAASRSDRLELYVDCAAPVEAVLELLPYLDRRGVVRGVREMTVGYVSGGLELVLTPKDSEPGWGQPRSGTVVVRGRGHIDAAALLDQHRLRHQEARDRPVWTAELAAKAGPLKAQRRAVGKAPLLLERHAASCSLASAVLRRPRLWDGLAGHRETLITCSVADHGQDWQVARCVATGTQIHDERLVDLLTDPVVGTGLRLCEHTCDEHSCCLRLIGADRRGYAGILTVNTVRAATETGPGGAGRAFAVRGEQRAPSRPVTRSPERSPAPRGRTAQLITAKAGVDPSELQGIAVHLGAAWASLGLRVGILVAGHDRGDWYWPRRTWPSQRVPGGAQRTWTRLRMADSDGQLYGHRVEADKEAAGDALREARARFDRTLLVEESESEWRLCTGLADTHVVVVNESPYQRTVPVPVQGQAAAAELPLSATESALLWRQSGLAGVGLNSMTVAGLLLALTDPEQRTAPDDTFTPLVQAELARLGTPVLACFPRAVHQPGRAPNAPEVTVLDPIDPRRSVLLLECAAQLARLLWPEATQDGHRDR